MKYIELSQNIEQSFIKVCDLSLKLDGINSFNDVKNLLSSIKEKKEEKPPELNG